MSDKENAAEKALAELLDKSMQAGDFLVEQAPMVVQELLVYKSFEHAAYALVLFLACSVFVFIALNRIKEFICSGDGDNLVVAAFSSLPAVMLFCFFFGNLLSFIKIMVAPKVYLLEYAAALVK